MHARLRAQTRALHRRVERASPFGAAGGSSGLDRDAYARHLAARLGFVRAVAPELARWGLDSGLDSDAARILADLRALGWSTAELAAIPTSPAPPRLPSFAHALGGLYVVAGARVSALSIVPRLVAALGLDPHEPAGIGYLTGELPAAAIQDRFAATMAWIDRFAGELDSAGRDAIVEGASASFSALACWLERAHAGEA